MVSATITQEQACRERWDAVVIGAGPAGAVSARGLAARGLKTLLVERKAFPRDKVCGGCLGQKAVSLLDHAGLSAYLKGIPSVPLRQAEIRTCGRIMRVDLPGGLAISRSDFDAMLVEAAIDERVEFLPQTTATLKECHTGDDPQMRTVELSGADVGQSLVRASVVVAADGLGHPSLRTCREFSDRVEPHSRMGLYATIPNDLPAFDLGRVTMCVTKPGYVGIVRLRSGALHLAASVDRNAVQAQNQPADLIAGILHDVNLPEIGRLDLAEWKGTVPLTRQSSTVATRRVFLIGDAAGYLEPFTGEGMTWALVTGLAVVPFVEQAMKVAPEDAERKWRECYRRFFRHRQDWCRRIAWAARRPWLASTSIGLMSLVPQLSRFLVRRLNQPVSMAEWNVT